MTNHHFLGGNVLIHGRDGRPYQIRGLTLTLAKRHAPALVAVHNRIPYQSADVDDFVSGHSADGRVFVAKWRLSLAVFFRGAPAGFLTAYLRDLDEKHPLQSVYIHRLAISEDHQRNQIGVQLVAFAVAHYFSCLPWLLTVTVQTNDEQRNEHVLDLYRRLGFSSAYRVSYPEKQDILFEVERRRHHPAGYVLQSWAPLRVPAAEATKLRPIENLFTSRFNIGPPAVYFATGSPEKLQQYAYLARCHGIDLHRVRHLIQLSEPQVEDYSPAAEGELVAAPLKLFSRFAARGQLYPVMVEDTMLFIEEFNDSYDDQAILPGADTKRWWRALGTSGILRLMRASTRRRARYVCQIGVNVAASRYEYFRSEINGVISVEERASAEALSSFPFTNPTFFHRIFVPEGSDQTLAEMEAADFVQHDYRRRCFSLARHAIMAASSLTASQLDLFNVG